MAEMQPADEKSRWTTEWSDEMPRFDASASSPALLRLLEGDENVRKALAAAGGGSLMTVRVLVPGCGRGYDLASFARAAVTAASSSSSSSPSPETTIIGWDYVPEAVRSVKEWLESPASGLAELRKSRRPPVAVEVEVADFFERAASSDSSTSPFTLAFDYTFFCALPPASREAWARAYSRLLARGTGLLITLIFPSVPPPGLGVEELPREEREAFRAAFGSLEALAADAAAQGPPWPVSPEEYERVLLSEGLFELVSCEAVPARLSHRGRGGREFVAVWRRTVKEEEKKGEKKLSAL